MKLKRKVAYVRVSTASSAQLHSYDFQEHYWRDKLSSDKDGEFCGVYADKGISGCSIQRRPQFLAMMADAREHKFDEIHTKSVSRFARNTVELLEAVRELRDLDIEVIFEKENIHTFNPTSEVFLTIAATIAENDLKVDSERQKWAIRHRIENGWISIGSGLFGYRMTDNNELEIVPDEAETVRKIFEWYLEGQSAQAIARRLNEANAYSKNARPWSLQRILEIISNEKFMGDTIMGKKVCINGKSLDNSNGQYGPRFYLEDTHEGIVSKETWRAAQAERARRKNDKLTGGTQLTYPFSGIIFCGKCGAHYRHKVNNSGKKRAASIWGCSQKLHKGVCTCSSQSIKDSVLKEKFIEAYNEFVTTRPQGLSLIALEEELTRIRKEESDFAALNMQHLIPLKSYIEEQKNLKAREKAVMERMQKIKGNRIHESDCVTITEFKEDMLARFIDKVVVNRETVSFIFYNGAKISKNFTNGQPGNKIGRNK